MSNRRMEGLAQLAAAFAVAVLLVAGTSGANEQPQKMEYVQQLEAAYGPPSQQGFGAAVFNEALRPTDDLATAALARYRYFVGPLWDRFGEKAWVGPWREVYSRPPGARGDIVAELGAIQDREARMSVALLLDLTENPAAARAALATAFDAPAVTELKVFKLGDGAAMSGLLVAGRRGATGDATYVVALMD